MILLGPNINISDSDLLSIKNYQHCEIIYQLTESIENLCEKLSLQRQLTSLNLWGNNIGDSGVKHLTALKQLTSLNLWGNNIGDSGVKILIKLDQLTSLNIGANNIGEQGVKHLANFDQLTSLNLGGNRIREQGVKHISTLDRLTSLNLGGNYICDRGVKYISMLDRLISLDLWGNDIGNDGVKYLTAFENLTSLNLYGNNVGYEGIKKLSVLNQLTSLNLWYNCIEDAGVKYIAKLNQLISLNLLGNNITKTGVNYLTDLSQLKILNIGDNNIGDDGVKYINKLGQLTSLNLWKNNIGNPGVKHLLALKKLTSLNVAENNIGNPGVKYLSNLDNLISLNLGGNNVGDRGAKHLASLNRLTVLNLRGNNIGESGVKHLTSLSQIRVLNLRANIISDACVKHFSSLNRLTALNLGESKIGDEGVRYLAALNQLISLDLSNNSKISDLSPLTTLFKRGVTVKVNKSDLDNARHGVYIADCSLKHPPPEIIQQGHNAILNYFEEIEAQGADRLFEAKMLIVGEGRAGKTSLVHRLYKPDEPLPCEDSTTKGIDIYKHEFELLTGRNFRLNVWDFGGQQIYHSTHQFFLTKRSLYILLDDTTKDHTTIHDDGFKYWLEVIELLSDESPVLIFQNEKGGRSKAIDVGGIKKRFPNVMNVYSGDLNDIDATTKLSTAIESQVGQLPQIGDKVPAKWVIIRSALEKQAQLVPYITQQDYFDLYEQYLDSNRSKALFLSSLFHSLGVFLHFQDHSLLKRIVILQNEWATEAVFRILDDEIVKSNFGRFTINDCERVWSESTYAEMHPELLGLMKKFELCYVIAKNTWLAPQLLSPEVPSELENWADYGDLVINYEYDFLPKGLINRLMVRMHRYAKNLQHSWATGVLLEKGNTNVLARTTEKGNEIVLSARGIECKEMLNEVSGELDALNESFEGLKGRVQKLIPCICTNCSKSKSPQFYRYQLLLKRKRNCMFKMECHESGEFINVLELLDGIILLNDQDIDIEPDRDNNDDINLSTKKIIKIFMASSKELTDDRNKFVNYLQELNNTLQTKGYFLEIIRWETFLDAMAKDGLQKLYNQEICACDIFVCLFMTKVGKYTEQEFDVARESFFRSEKPLIYTYFKNKKIPIDELVQADTESFWQFREKLKQLGHYWVNYKNVEQLKLHFNNQLTKLINEKYI